VPKSPSDELIIKSWEDPSFITTIPDEVDLIPISSTRTNPD